SIDWVAGHIEQTTEHAFADWNAYRSAGVRHAHPTFKSFGGRHGHRAHPIFAEVLLHFERQLCWVAIHFIFNFESVVDFRQRLFVRKFHVHNGTDYLNYISFIHKTSLATERHLRRGDLEQLGGDAGLTHLVVFERAVLDELVRIIGAVFDRYHAR